MSQNRRNFGFKLAESVVKFRWLVLLGCIILAGAAGYGGQFLKFNNDYKLFFSEDNPQLQAFEGLQKKFTKDDNVFIVVSPRDGKVFTQAHLAAIEELVDSSWQVPYSSRVDAVTNFQHTKSVEDDLYVDDLASDSKNKTNQELQSIQKIATEEPLLIHRLINDEASVTGVNVVLKLPEPSEVAETEKEVAAYVRRMTSNWEAKYPELETHLSGIVMLSNAFGEAAEGDIATLFPLMFLIIILVLIIITRSFTGTISTLLVLFMSIMVAMGLGGWFGFQLNAVSAAAPTMILTLAVADSIHILVTMLQYMRKGMEKREAIKQSISINFMPVFITSATTVVGFLTLNLSDAPPFHHLGNIAAIGVSAAFLYSILLLPALMAILPVRVKVATSDPETAKKSSYVNRLAEIVIANNKKILWGSTAVMLAFIFFATQNTLNEQFVAYFGKDIQFRTDTDYMNDNLTGIYNIEYAIPAGEEGGISNPEYLNALEKFEKWYESQDKVVHVNSYTEVARRVNRSMHGDDESYYKIPQNREEAAQYLLLYEMSLPFGLDLNNQINVDKSETRFTVTVDNITAKELIALSEGGENWLKDNAPAYMSGKDVKGISTAIMFSHLTQRQISSMAIGGGWALLLITIVLILALRSFKFGLLSIIPNIIPLGMAFGVWFFLDGQITSGLAIVFSMTIGIVVDDTVHLLAKYLRARRELGYSNEDAVRYSFDTVGRAIIVTTVVLSAGFLVLGQSSFTMNSGMAKLTTITIILALIIDLLFLPALLLAVSGKNKLAVSADTSTSKAEPTLTKL